MPHATLPERFFPLNQPDALDRLLNAFAWCVVFKAGSGDKTVEAWLVAQRALEPRRDVPVGFIQLPRDRPASLHVVERTGIAHRSPQLILFRHARVCFHLDELAITPEQLLPHLAEHLPAEIGPRVHNEAITTLEPYRRLLSTFLSGELPEERFQWAYLERLKREATWRDTDTFALINELFENPHGRDLQPATIIALEFQGQLAGRLEPLRPRAQRQLDRLEARGHVA